MPRRTNPRHSDFDYRTPAAYFVTLCTHERRRLFGAVRRERMVLNPLGRIVVGEWKGSEAMRDEVILDAFVVMPNHMHGIVCLVPPEVENVSPRGYQLDVGSDPTRSKRVSTSDTGTINGQNAGTADDGDADDHSAFNDNVGTTGRSSLRSRGDDWPTGPLARSLSAMIAGFKSAATTRINTRRGTSGAPVWQGRYHDRILRNGREWKACRRYIEQNPGRWWEDRYHPDY